MRGREGWPATLPFLQNVYHATFHPRHPRRGLHRDTKCVALHSHDDLHDHLRLRPCIYDVLG